MTEKNIMALTQTGCFRAFPSVCLTTSWKWEWNRCNKEYPDVSRRGFSHIKWPLFSSDHLLILNTLLGSWEQSVWLAPTGWIQSAAYTVSHTWRAREQRFVLATPYPTFSFSSNRRAVSANICSVSVKLYQATKIPHIFPMMNYACWLDLWHVVAWIWNLLCSDGTKGQTVPMFSKSITCTEKTSAKGVWHKKKQVKQVNTKAKGNKKQILYRLL